MSYSLDVISHLSEFKGRPFKKHNVEGIETIGVWGNEPFEVVFRNNTYQTVQVKLSIDGTDLLTGNPATTSAVGDMFVVKPYDKLSLKAWPESNKGGAQFIFTSAEKSVAVNTHGNLNSRGVIAAAVFTESYVAPYTVYGGGYSTTFGSIVSGTIGNLSCDTNNATMDYMELDLRREIDDSDDGIVGPAAAGADNRLGSLTLGDCEKSAAPAGRRRARQSLKSLAAVGAGQHVSQRIENVKGFVKPALSTTVQVRYLWWDDLVDEVKAQGKNVTSGFPGDEVKIMSIGATPRIGENKVKRSQSVELSRF